jgi:hypothetical protein
LSIANAAVPHCAGGGLKIYLHCIDKLGHAAMGITLQADPRGKTGTRGQTEGAQFSLAVNAAEIDAFFLNIEKISPVAGKLEPLVGVTAILRGSEP